MCFFFNHAPTPEFYPLSLHDALPICIDARHGARLDGGEDPRQDPAEDDDDGDQPPHRIERDLQRLPERYHAAGREVTLASSPRSEEHTSELQSHSDLVCRLLLEKKNQ